MTRLSLSSPLSDNSDSLMLKSSLSLLYTLPHQIAYNLGQFFQCLFQECHQNFQRLHLDCLHKWVYINHHQGLLSMFLWIFCDNFRSFFDMTSRFLVGSHFFFFMCKWEHILPTSEFFFRHADDKLSIFICCKAARFFVEDQTCFLVINWKRKLQNKEMILNIVFQSTRINIKESKGYVAHQRKKPWHIGYKKFKILLKVINIYFELSPFLLETWTNFQLRCAN